jgi:hypothetical protein
MWCNDLTSVAYGEHLDQIRRDLARKLDDHREDES